MGKKYSQLNPKQPAVARAIGMMRQNEYYNKVDDAVPCIYAALALALHEEGYGYKRIARVFHRSQEIWDQHSSEGINKDMIDWCEEKIGITLSSGRVRDVDEHS